MNAFTTAGTRRNVNDRRIFGSGHRNTRRPENDGRHASIFRGFARSRNGARKIERICLKDPAYADSRKNRPYVYFPICLPHHGLTRARMRLVARHRGRRIIQDHKNKIRVIVYGVYRAGDTGGKEGRVADKGEVTYIRFNSSETLRDRHARPHAKTRIRHVERLRVA